MKLLKITNNEMSAKELYDLVFDGVERKTHFSMWMKRNIERFSIDENVDYWKEKQESTGGRPFTDFILSESSATAIYQREKSKYNIGINNRKETIFFYKLFNILTEMNYLKGIVEISLFPYPVLNYKIDCYIPAVNLAIEYNEDYHYTKEQRLKDSKRQKEIQGEIGCHFIEVKQGKEDTGIANILDYMIKVLN